MLNTFHAFNLFIGILQCRYNGMSYLDVKKVSVKVEAPGSVVGGNSSWSLTSWNHCNLELETKYSLDPQAKSQFRLLSSLPNENGVKLKLRNVIPTLHRFTRIDSKFIFESMRPLTKYVTWVKQI